MDQKRENFQSRGPGRSPGKGGGGGGKGKSVDGGDGGLVDNLESDPYFFCD